VNDWDDDESFAAQLDAYLDPPVEPNAALANVEIVWVDDNLAFGSTHIAAKHGVTKEEVEQVLFEIPPMVEAKRSREHPGRTLFWGATRHDRWLIVSCEDWTEGGQRYLKPITAFEPADGDRYWRRR
jgi:hypothetical protein